MRKALLNALSLALCLVLGNAALLATAVMFTTLSTPVANAQTYEALYRFKGSVGAGPSGNLLMDGSGNLYGVANYGGSALNGSIYKLNSDGSTIRTHNFSGGADGGTPYAGVIRDGAGNLYGTATRGGIFGGICGTGAASGCGVVYKLDPSGIETVLYSFTGGTDGWEPVSGLVRDPAGNLYGTTELGGVFSGKCGSLGCGVVFKIDPSGKQTVIHAFAGQPDGKYPGTESLVRDSRGNLYGVTKIGGRTGNPACANNQGCGLIFKVDTAGNYKVLYAFTGGFDGGFPGGLVLDEQGNLYGLTDAGGDFNRGTLSKLDPTGKESVLYSFSVSVGRLTRDGAGNFYGITGDSVFKLDTGLNFTTLHTFAGRIDGSDPLGGVLVDAAGNMYGTTYFGGNPKCGSFGAGCGMVYKITP